MLDSNTTVDIWKKFPFSHLEVQSFKKSWAWKDSYVKLKKKKNGNRRKTLYTRSAHPKVIPAEIPNENTSIHQINLFSFGAKKKMLF